MKMNRITPFLWYEMGMVKLNVKGLKDAYAGKPAARQRKT